MSKKIKAIIWGGVAILVLVAALLVLLYVKDKQPDEQEEMASSFNATLTSLVNENTYDLVSAYISNEQNSYTIELVGEEIWRIKELMDYDNLDAKYLQTLAECGNINANQIIEENCTNLAKFGFDAPILTFELKYNNGHEYKFSVGAFSSDGSVQYIKRDGESTVYGMPGTSIGNLYLSKYDYLDKTVVKAIGTDDSGNQVEVKLNQIIIENKGQERILLKEVPDEEWNPNSVLNYRLRMYEPGLADISESTLENKILTAMGLNATGILLDNPDEEAMAEYGFDDPTSTFQVDYDDTYSVKVIVGKATRGPGYTSDTGVTEETDCYYVMREGGKQVYLVPAEALTWLSVTPDSMVSTAVVLPYISDVKSIDVIYGLTAHTLEFALGDDPTDMAQITAKFMGKDVNADYAKRYMQLVLYTAAQGLAEPIESGEPELTIIYHYRDGSSDSVKIYVDDDMNTTIMLNDAQAYRGRAAFIDKVKKETAHLSNNEPVDFDW